mmetsp:Transcript_9922/g.30079  ORF Transcript_9922/g.30079 Transcript_9922/m.30079 type:complete len:349 (+) Transcript_9922:705-1751(+)
MRSKTGTSDGRLGDRPVRGRKVQPSSSRSTFMRARRAWRAVGSSSASSRLAAGPPGSAGWKVQPSSSRCRLSSSRRTDASRASSSSRLHDDSDDSRDADCTRGRNVQSASSARSRSSRRARCRSSSSRESPNRRALASSPPRRSPERPRVVATEGLNGYCASSRRTASSRRSFARSIELDACAASRDHTDDDEESSSSSASFFFCLETLGLNVASAASSRARARRRPSSRFSFSRANCADRSATASGPLGVPPDDSLAGLGVGCGDGARVLAGDADRARAVRRAGVFAGLATAVPDVFGCWCCCGAFAFGGAGRVVVGSSFGGGGGSGGASSSSSFTVALSGVAVPFA